MLNVVSRHFGCTRKSIERLRRRFHDSGNVADRPQNGRPRVTTAADDLAAPTKQESDCSSNRKILLYSSTDCQKSVETKRSTYSYVPTVLRSNCHPASSNGKTGLVPSPALPTC